MSEAQITIRATNQASQAFREVADDAKQMEDDLRGSSEVGQEVSEGLEQAGEGAEAAGEGFEAAGESAGSMGENLEAAGESLSTVGEAAGATGDEVGTMSESLTTAGESATEAGESLTTMGEGVTTLNEGLTETGTTLEDTNTALEDTGTALEDTNTALEDTGTALEDTNTAFEDTGTALEDTQTALEDTNTSLEDTGTALDDTGTALGDVTDSADTAGASFEGVGDSAETSQTGVEGMGTAAEDLGGIFAGAGTDADTLGDAMGGVGESAEGAQGGLDSTNTMAGTLGGTMNTTGGQAAGMGSKFATAGTAMAGLAGVGVSLFNTFDAIGDSAANVEAAEIKLDMANKKIDSSFLALDKTTQKMIDNQELGITGAEEFAAAQDELNKLVEAGVTSGDEFDAALQRMNEAAGNLTSTTKEGNQVIEQAKTQTQGLSIGLDKLSVLENNLENQTEALNQSYVQLFTQTMLLGVGAAGQVSTLVTSLKGKQDALGGATGKLGGAFGKFGGLLNKIPLPLAIGGFGKLGIIIAIVATAAGIFVSQYDKIRPTLIAVGDALKGAAKFIMDIGGAIQGVLEDYARWRGATEEQIKGNEDLGKSQQETGKTTVGLGDNFRQLMKDLGLDEVANMIAGTETLGSAEAATAVETKKLSADSQGFAIAAREAGTEGMSATDMFAAMQGEIVNLGGGFSSVNGIIMKTTPEMEKLGTSFEGTSGALEKQQAVLQGSAEEYAKLTEGGIFLSESQLKAAEEAENLEKVVASQMETTRENVQAYKEESDAINENINKYIDSNDVMNLSLDQRKQLSAALDETFGKVMQQEDALEGEKLMWENVTQALLDNNTKRQENIRAMAEEMSGINNAAKAQAQYQQALTDATLAMIEDTDAKNANAQAIITLADSTTNYQNVLATLREEHANSIDALADVTIELTDAEARYLAIQTAVNEYKTGLMEEEIALRASIQATNDAKIALQELENAYLRGVESIDQWGLSIAAAAEEEQGAIDRLATFGLTFEDLPGAMSPTLESLKQFKEGTEASGFAAIEFGQQVLEAFEPLTGEVRSKIEELAGIVKEGGEKMNEAKSEWFADFATDIGRQLEPAEAEFIESMRSMITEGEAVFAEFNLDQMQGEFSKSFQSMEEGFRTAAENSKGVFSETFSAMADIAGSGSEAAVVAMQEAFSSGAPPQEILRQMEVIKQELPNLVGLSAEEAAARLKEKLAEGSTGAGTDVAGTVGEEFQTEAAMRFGEAWLVIGEGLKAFLDSIPGYMAEIDVTSMATNFGESWLAVGEGLREFFTEIPVFFQENTITPMIEALVQFDEAWLAHGEGLREFFAEIPVFYQENTITPMIEALLQLDEAWVAHGEGLQEFFTNSATFYQDKTITPMTQATTKFSTDTTTQMKQKFGEAFGDINTKANTAIQTMDQKFSQMIDKITSAMKQKFGEAFGDINTKADTSSRNFEQKFDNATNQATQKIESDFGSSFQQVEQDASSAAQSMESDFMSAIRSIESAFNSMISSMESQISALESRARSAASAAGGGGAGAVTGANRALNSGGGLFGQHGLHTTLPKDTTIFAHAGERVDIYPKGSIKHGPNDTRMMAPTIGGGSHVPLNINLNVRQEVDGREYARLMGRYYMEGYSGA